MDNLECKKPPNLGEELYKVGKEGQIKSMLHSFISEGTLKKIEVMLNDIGALTILERLFLYLKLPTECSKVTDPLRQPINPLGSRSEISQTIVWIKTHLEVDPELSLPKQDVYNEYFEFCRSGKIKPLSTADFGKVMKQVYPEVKPRRLGTRGNSRYCYAGLRRRIKLSAPLLPDIMEKSSEVPYNPSHLIIAAWEIVKEWSETQLQIRFPSVEALACHLVLHFSVGRGTTAAALITSFFKDDASGTTQNTFKPRNAQVQLPVSKVLKKNDGASRDQKRKVQITTPKIENRMKCKKRKAQSVPVTCDINMSEKSEYGCDKSKSLGSFQNLPDFSNFQKAAAATIDVNRETNEYALELSTNGKLPIPRLSAEKVVSSETLQKSSPSKYKVIQPKPEVFDTTADDLEALNYINNNGSQSSSYALDVETAKSPDHLISVIKNELENEPADSCSIPFSRERLISIGSMDKDALDDYLGGSNSQEHEEELTQYFEDKNEVTDHESKLSQLRQLLISKQKNSNPSCLQTETMNENFHATSTFDCPATVTPHVQQQQQQQVGNLPHFSILNARRRVSFDVPFPEETIPPSPNTRRKNFNFTPISPNSLSPTGGQSKCSSGTTSPFVSPVSTPIPRGKFFINCSSVQKLDKKAKINQYHLNIETIGHDLDVSNSPMSAPASPRFKKTTNKTNYKRCTPYPNKKTVNVTQTASSQGSLSPEITELLSDKSLYLNVNSNCRSQSVPLRQMHLKAIPEVSLPFAAALPNVTSLASCVSSGFFQELDTKCNGCSTSEMINGLPQNSDVYEKIKNVDLDLKYAPSRSVPGTPVPYGNNTKTDIEKRYRSYPSTPITNDIFSYNHNQDFLLNGQPIQDKTSFLNAADLPDNVFVPTHQDYNVTAAAAALGNDILAEDSKCHFSFDGQLPQIDFSAKDGMEVLQDTCLVAEDEFAFKSNDFSET